MFEVVHAHVSDRMTTPLRTFFGLGLGLQSRYAAIASCESTFARTLLKLVHSTAG